jgi:hypothetical protein
VERALQMLVELLQLVVAAAIGLVVLVIFLSHFIGDTHHQCNECAAVANLRTINTAQVTYKVSLSSSTGTGTYGSMTDLIAAGLLDETFTSMKAGYNYSITLDATGSGYTAEAVRASKNTGRYGYYSATDAVVRYSTIASLAPAGQSGRSVR